MMSFRPLDSQFDGVGKCDGIVIWRIDKMKLATVSLNEYGIFYENDSYLLLKTYGTPALSWNIHMWIGKDSSADEQCVCAYKSLELEEFLNRKPIQYREIQNHESKQFLSYFKNGIRYMVGGITGGLRPVVTYDEKERHLFHVKGKFNCRVQQVAVSVHSLNKGDAFILVNGSKIFVWNGPKCNVGERIKAAQVARSLRDEKAGRAQIILIDDDWDTNQEFYALLNSKTGIEISDSAEDDMEFERRFDEKVKLFRVSDASGTMSVAEVKPPLSKDSLDTNDCFFLDLGSSGVYVWVGNACTDDERRIVWLQAKSYLVSRKLPPHTPLIKVNEGSEPAIMKIALNWPPDHPRKNEFIEGLGVAKIREEEHQVDVNCMYKRANERAIQLPDDGSGTVKVWRVVQFKLEEIPLSDYGIFFSGDSYIVHYRASKATYSLIYFWLGMLSTVDERGAAAMFTTQINQRQFGGHAVEVRLTQSKESAHFLSIFGGYVITLLGGKASGFRDRKGGDDERILGRIRLFQVRNNHVSQVQPRAESLNSGDVFVLNCVDESFVWIGRGSTENEKNVAKKCLQRLKITQWKEVKEGAESDSFWKALGGKASYATGGTFNVPTQYTARLFHCSNSRGYFHVEEICDFSQCDLEPDDVMLLDTLKEIFVWIGNGANLTEQKEVLKLAMQYVGQDPCGRNLDDTIMLTIKQGFEPFTFTAHFPSWDANYWKKLPSYEQIKRSLKEEADGCDKIRTVQETMEQFQKTYPIEILRKPVEYLPYGVDPCRKEEHLSSEDFKNVFGYSREHFDKLRPWKRLDEKRRVGLF